MDKEETPLKQIRTFQGDVAEALHRQQSSLVSIQRAEHLRSGSIQSAADTPSKDTAKRKEFTMLVLGSLALFILGAVGVWFTYNEFVRKTATPAVVVPDSRFVSANTEININLTVASREALINALSDASRNVSPGELTHIILSLSTGEFLNILGSQAPSSLVRAFDPLFMFGVLGGSPTKGVSDFLIIKLVSFENAFAGMLLWEKNLAQDIGPLFATAPLLKNILPESAFVDVTDRNKDVRMLALGDQPVLLYSFFDNNMLIITDSIETLRALIDRLTREKLSR